MTIHEAHERERESRRNLAGWDFFGGCALLLALAGLIVFFR